MLTFASLFTGIGGFDLGFERAGLECVLQCEIDHHCQTLLKDKWPHVKKEPDVKRVKRVSADVICGGFPCQDVSVAGKRKGLAGERSGLWFEFHRIVKRNRPRWVVVENVPGLLSSNEGRDFAAILRGLVRCGYGVSWRILDAQYFGLAQRRRRVFIVGSLGDGRSAQVLFESEGVSRDSPSRREARASASRIIGTLTASGGGLNRPGGQGNELDFCVAVDVRSSREQSDGISGTLQSKKTGGYSLSYTNPIAFAWQQGVGINDRSYPVRAGNYSGTLSESRVDAVGGDFGVRRLTPVECERLQGFSDGYTESFSDSVRYHMLGNAVAVPCAEWIARRISHQFIT